MAKNLVIVESPAKAKTIRKFLGSAYEVTASAGHVRDLPKSQLGVDVKNGFEPKYITIRGKGDLVSELRKEARKAEHVYLATDPDREGEAISWHLAAMLELPLKDKNRITFNEITKDAVRGALKKARPIDLNLVDAQQARRVLDRLVGYEISPLLWKKVRKGLSAGRVQSAALKLLCDREQEIKDFTQEEYWSIEAVFKKAKAKGSLEARLSRIDQKKAEIPDEKTGNELIERIRKAGDFRVSAIKYGKRVKKAPLPFTTSTLQQEASHRIGMSPQKTMQIAQQLYEGIDVGHGSVGLITYLRTDSVRIADEAKAAAREYIAGAYGTEYLGSGSASSGTKRIQDAHEAIRPTYLTNRPDAIASYLTKDQLRLYTLIFERFLASQMAAAVYDTIAVTLDKQEFEFQSSGSKLHFPGFLKVYKDPDEEKDSFKMIEGLQEQDLVQLASIQGEQHFTQPPARYSEASLIRTLEENGVGRPSTYAPTIATLTARDYVTKVKKLLHVTELGMVVNKLMSDTFPQIVDIHFTAEMENRLDDVGEGKMDWKKLIGDFYEGFEPLLKKASAELEKVQIQDEVTDIICEKCGRNMVLKMGRFGKFYACPGFPACRNAKPLIQTLQVPCPKCGKPIQVRKSQKGKTFYGCSGYPACDFVAWDKPVAKKCPRCGGLMVEKKGRAAVWACTAEGCGYKEKAPDQ